MTHFSLSLISLLVMIYKLQAAPMAAPDRPNEVTYVDFLARQNLVRHKTGRYESNTRSMVLRRGELLDFNVRFSRDHDKTMDRTRLEFCFGDNPSLSDNSMIYVPVVADRQPVWTNRTNEWDSRILNIQGRQMDLQVLLPANIPVGKWHLRISTKLANSTNIQTFIIRDTFFIIFNAWSLSDQVYMENDDWRQEYLMNEVGKIYIGTYTYPVGRKWTYSQFDHSVLPTVMYLLDKTKLSVAERADVVKVSRAVSAIVNSNDEGGLVVGDWSGNYADGLSPWKWTDSATIFRKFIANGYRQVKFGQCWVFGGLTTTVLKTLGIPGRTISNFVSAHDTDASLSVDKFYSGGSDLSGVNGDSIWNFHVWSDAWMARDDLPAGYGGWQAIDATPQERSMEHYQLGPASLEAIKQGKVGYAYDVGFVFSEVNANVVYWQLDGRSRYRWIKTRIQSGHFGRKILTKRIGVIDERSRSGTNDAENIVDQYKYPDGSAESKQAYVEAAKAGGLLPLIEA